MKRKFKSFWQKYEIGFMLVFYNLIKLVFSVVPSGIVTGFLAYEIYPNNMDNRFKFWGVAWAICVGIVFYLLSRKEDEY